MVKQIHQALDMEGLYADTEAKLDAPNSITGKKPENDINGLIEKI